MEVILLILVLLVVVAIIGVIIYIYNQIKSTKQFVQNELAKFASLVNDAQYNEYKFDKLNESNIKTIDQKLKDINSRLDRLDRVKPLTGSKVA